ncbi:snRNA-activating protein complex subunit [Anaeramoeba flamelloides]|uniref:snRNA-activating protein complex subunit n=1 Tax=Anaeramoeba flamelloides TaxID=1746091 RepID=A0AAV7ZY67_9EUKA|nr:snRNA-activating protein complex subunit [Anaeramoeba flamelloides]
MGRSTNESLKHLDFSELFISELKKEEEEMSLWTQKDDELLKDLVKVDHKTNWELVSQNFENFDSTMCLKRYRKILNIETKKGMWTDIEDNLLIKAIKLFGNSNWAQVSVFVYGRNSKQCRERWNNQLNPDINRSQFTIEEEELLIQKQKELGNKWTTIAQFFENRPDNMIKNAWHSLRVRKGLPNYFSPKKKNNKRRKNARKKKKILIGKGKGKGKGNEKRKGMEIVTVKEKENEREKDMGMDMEIIQGIENDKSNFNFIGNKNEPENENENETEKEFQNEQIGNRNIKKKHNKGSKFNTENNCNNKKGFKKPNLKIEIKNNSKTIPQGIKPKNKKKTPDIKMKKLNFFNKKNKLKSYDSFNNNQKNDSENEFYSPQSPREHTNSPKLNPLQDVSFKIRKLNLSTQNLTTKSTKMKYPLSARSPRIKNYPLSPRSRNYQLSPRLSKKSPKFKRKNTKKKRKKKKKKKKKIVISPRRNRLVSGQFQKNNLKNGNENQNILDSLFARESPNKNEFKMISPINEKTKNILFNNINDFNYNNLDNNTLDNNTLDNNTLNNNTLSNNTLGNNDLNSLNQTHKPNKNENINENINENNNEKQQLNISNLNQIPKENIIEKKQIFNINNNIKNMIQDNIFSDNNHNISNLIHQTGGEINLFNNSTFMDKVINDDKKIFSNNNDNNNNLFEQTETDFIPSNQSINSNTELKDYLLLSPQDLKINTFFDNTINFEFNKNTYTQQDYLFGDNQFSNYTFLNNFDENNN